MRSQALNHIGAAKKIRKETEDKKQTIEQVFSKLDDSNRQIKDFVKKSLVSQFLTEMGFETEKAKNTYDFALSFKDDDVSDALYRKIVVEILNGTPPTRRKYAEILRPEIDDPNNTLSDRQKTLSFYLLLATFILNGDDSEYNEYLEKFQTALVDIRDPDKETAAANFGANIFEKKIRADRESIDEVQRAKIAKINAIWGLIP